MNKNLGSFTSRKLWYAIGTSIAILVVGIAAGFWPALRPMVETLVGGELGALALYLGGNVTQKHILAKNGLMTPASGSDSDDDSEDDEKEETDVKSTPPVEPHPEETR